MAQLSVPLSYSRLILLISSWYFVLNKPEIFLALFMAQNLLFVVQICMFTTTETYREPELSKQLKILMTRLASSIMIFAVIR